MSRNSLPRVHTYDDLIAFCFKDDLNKSPQKRSTSIFDVLPCLPQILTHTSIQELQKECEQSRFTVPDTAETDEQNLVVLCQNVSASLMLFLNQCVRLVDVVMITDVFFLAAPLLEPTSSLCSRIGEVCINIKPSDLTSINHSDAPRNDNHYPIPQQSRGPLDIQDTHQLACAFRDCNEGGSYCLSNIANKMAEIRLPRPHIVLVVDCCFEDMINKGIQSGTTSYIPPLVGRLQQHSEPNGAPSVYTDALKVVPSSLARFPIQNQYAVHPHHKHRLTYLVRGTSLKCIAIATLVNAATFDDDHALAGIANYRRYVLPDIEDLFTTTSINPEAGQNNNLNHDSRKFVSRKQAELLQNCCPRRVFEVVPEKSIPLNHTSTSRSAGSRTIAIKQQEDTSVSSVLEQKPLKCPTTTPITIAPGTQQHNMIVNDYRCTECLKCSLPLPVADNTYTWTICSTSALSAIDIFRQTLTIAQQVFVQLQESPRL